MRFSIYPILLIILFSCNNENKITVSSNYFVADGVSSGIISAKGKRTKLYGPFGDTSAINIIKKIKKDKRFTIYFKSTKKNGIIFFKDRQGKKYRLTFFKDIFDNDKDGYPDRCELWKENDRTSFREWFIKIAISQYFKRSASWNKKERDCAGLIRYSYRESLKKHNRNWFYLTGITIENPPPEITEFAYPKIPIIGKNIFAVKSKKANNSFKIKINNECYFFSNFADVENLLKKNCHFTGKNINLAKKGDILFFRYLKNGTYLYHSMIYLGVINKKKSIIYHTGSKKVLKLVPTSYLNDSIIFRPIEWNHNFLGVYRFNILE